MTTEVATDLISRLGTPLAILFFIAFFIWKFTPKVLEVYKQTKEKEQAAFTERQKQYQLQSERIVEVAAQSNHVISEVTAAVRNSTAISGQVVATLTTLEQSHAMLMNKLAQHDVRAESIDKDIQKILENIRR